MSGLVVLPSPGARDRRLAEADFGFFVDDPDVPEFRVLRYYSPYEDLVVNPHMLDDFESDIRNGCDHYSILRPGLEVAIAAHKLAAVLPFIELARRHHAYVVIIGD